MIRREKARQTVAEIVSENRHGDPRYLDEARKALADLRTLWGVDAPDRHQGLDDRLIAPEGLAPPGLSGSVRCRQRLGGLLRYYYRAA